MSDNSYNILQTPNDINLEDLPDDIEINQPFTIKENLYICEKNNVKLLVCDKVSDEETSIPVETEEYFVIRKIN